MTSPKAMNAPQPSPDNTVELSDTRKQVRHFIKAHKAFDKYPETVILENSLVNYINQYVQQANLTARIDERKQAKRMSREITKRGLTYLAINYDWWLRRAYKLREELRQAKQSNQLKGGK